MQPMILTLIVHIITHADNFIYIILHGALLADIDEQDRFVLNAQCPQ